MMQILLYVLGVLIFLAAIFVSISLHELGHLYYAKKFGCRVSQYMVGFGPTVKSWKRGDTEYGVKLIPLGGYVKIIGMFPPETDREKRAARGEMQIAQPAPAPGEETEQILKLRKSNTGLFAQMVSQTRAAEFELVRPEDRDRLFYKLPPSKKIIVMLAGPGVNIALAFLCLLGVYGLYGTHDTVPTGSPVVSSVSDCVIPQTQNRTACQPGDAVSPAKAAGLHAGDRIVTFNGEDVSSWDQLSELIHGNGSGPMQLTVLRDGKQVILQQAYSVAIPRDLDGTRRYETVGFVGVQPEQKVQITHHGPMFTMLQMGDMTAHAVSSVAELPGRVYNVAASIFGQEKRDQDGPISVIGGSRLAGEVASSTSPGLDVGGKAALLGLVVGSFNLFIGIFNLIPLMPLDGGHIAGAAWEGIRRWFAKLFRRKDPGHVNVAAQLPLAYVLGFALLSMSIVLMVGDIVVPLSSGL